MTKATGRPHGLPARPAIDRIMDKLVLDEDDNWLFTGSLNNWGYGRIRVGSRSDGSRRLMGVHIVTYEHFIGSVPEGFELDHLCRVRNCANPWHLEPVTKRENILRGECPAAKQARQTECSAGHSLDPTLSDVYIDPKGRRVCRICRRRYNRIRREQRRDKTVSTKRREAGKKASLARWGPPR